MRLKVLVVGACKSGKTRVANVLSEAVEDTGVCSPTQGVRILEYEPATTFANKWVAELWDCSGHQRFESCMPALQHGAHAAILVVDPCKAEAARAAADRFSPLLANRPPGQAHALVVLLPSGPFPASPPLRLTGAWIEARQLRADLAADGGQQLRRDVATFLSDVAAVASDRDEFSFA
ncbi:Hypothetical predicted protein [Cloeon dipterum]|uniref:Uncharacterized protein n=1 Tax=Cloeon dipterum TaxID=197152 RepID=A0A8S1DNG7_9INSE|nr:Hypothetical predicted protein [Cloeon dipterum]